MKPVHQFIVEYEMGRPSEGGAWWVVHASVFSDLKGAYDEMLALKDLHTDRTAKMTPLAEPERWPVYTGRYRVVRQSHWIVMEVEP